MGSCKMRTIVHSGDEYPQVFKNRFVKESGFAVLFLDTPQCQTGDDGQDTIENNVNTDQESEQYDCTKQRVDHD